MSAQHRPNLIVAATGFIPTCSCSWTGDRVWSKAPAARHAAEQHARHSAGDYRYGWDPDLLSYAVWHEPTGDCEGNGLSESEALDLIAALNEPSVLDGGS